ncbi:MAG: hypothetical protein QM765_45995 [Myxococcales bacterium]
MSDDSRQDGPKDEAPASLDEARAARELAEAMDGKAGAKPDEQAFETAALIASARRPELPEESRARIADDLFGPPAAAKRPARWGWAVAATVLVAVGGATLVGGLGRKAAPAPSMVVASGEGREFHRKAELLIAEMMPQPTAADRAQAIADRARARLKQEAAP